MIVGITDSSNGPLKYILQRMGGEGHDIRHLDVISDSWNLQCCNPMAYCEISVM